jgi:hypothetical protein
MSVQRAARAAVGIGPGIAPVPGYVESQDRNVDQASHDKFCR